MRTAADEYRQEDAGETPVGAALRRRGVPHRVFRHAHRPESLEDAAAGRGHRPEQVVRCLLFRVRPDDFALVLVAGPDQLPWKPLRKRLGSSRVRLATAEEVLEVTGHPIGAVAPFGMPGRPRILVDASLLDESELSMGSGVHGTAIIIDRDDLLGALGDYEGMDLLDEGSA